MNLSLGKDENRYCRPCCCYNGRCKSNHLHRHWRLECNLLDFQRLQDMSHELHTSIMECQKQWHFQVNACYAAFHDELILQDHWDQAPKSNIYLWFWYSFSCAIQMINHLHIHQLWIDVHNALFQGQSTSPEYNLLGSSTRLVEDNDKTFD